MEITVDQMYQIENKGHDMGFLKKFMMENAGAAAVRRLITKFENISSNILISNFKKKSPYLHILRIQGHKLNSIFNIS